MTGTATASAIDVGSAGRRRATLVGALAPLLWAALALLVTAAQPIPPFELVFLTFGIAFLLVLGKWGVELGAGRGLRPHRRRRGPRGGRPLRKGPKLTGRAP